MYVRLNIEPPKFPVIFHCKYSQLNDTTLNLKTSLHYPYHIATSQFAQTIWLPEQNEKLCADPECVLTDSCTVRLLCNALKKVL